MLHAVAALQSPLTAPARRCVAASSSAAFPLFCRGRDLCFPSPVPRTMWRSHCLSENWHISVLLLLLFQSLKLLLLIVKTVSVIISTIPSELIIWNYSTCFENEPWHWQGCLRRRRGCSASTTIPMRSASTLTRTLTRFDPYSLFLVWLLYKVLCQGGVQGR